jgi:hypothetical protein
MSRTVGSAIGPPSGGQPPGRPIGAGGTVVRNNPELSRDLLSAGLACGLLFATTGAAGAADLNVGLPMLKIKENNRTDIVQAL